MATNVFSGKMYCTKSEENTRVVPTISSQEKIEAIIAELHGQDEFPYQALCDLVFTIIDRFCESIAPQTGPGRRKTYRIALF